MIAVVGLSDRENRPSHSVAKYLQSQGYRIIPVNPQLTGPVLGEPPYPDLGSVPAHIALVHVFRRAAAVPPLGGSPTARGPAAGGVPVGTSAASGAAGPRGGGSATGWGASGGRAA